MKIGYARVSTDDQDLDLGTLNKAGYEKILPVIGVSEIAVNLQTAGNPPAPCCAGFNVEALPDKDTGY